MISQNNIASLVGATVTDPDGEKIGTVKQIFVDPRSGQPTWATVKTGLFGTAETFIPLDRAEVAGDDVRVAYTRDFVKDAPRVKANEGLQNDEEDTLYAYYHGENSATVDGAGTNADAADSRPDVVERGTETREPRLRRYEAPQDAPVDSVSDADRSGGHRGRHL